MAEDVQKIYIREAADLLNRRMGTLRKWESEGVLPEHLIPAREEHGRKQRYWTPEQIAGIQAWIQETDRRPGKGLPTWNPTPEQVEETVRRMRRPRS